MIPTVAILTALLTALPSLPAETTAHPGHSSIAELEHDPRSGRGEIALELDAAALERALERHFGGAVDVEKDPKAGEKIFAWSRARLVLRSADGKGIDLEWVGFELDGGSAWIYVEADLGASIEGLEVTYAVMTGLEPFQINTLNVRSGARRATLTFTARKTTRKLALPPPRPAPEGGD